MGEGYIGSFRVLDEPMGRRMWSNEEKLRIVMESYVPGT
ncbi:IS66 family insertion sequence element accessory protein TnpB, partial [Cereibacter changlensis]